MSNYILTALNSCADLIRLSGPWKHAIRITGGSTADREQLASAIDRYCVEPKVSGRGGYRVVRVDTALTTRELGKRLETVYGGLLIVMDWARLSESNRTDLAKFITDYDNFRQLQFLYLSADAEHPRGLETFDLWIDLNRRRTIRRKKLPGE